MGLVAMCVLLAGLKAAVGQNLTADDWVRAAVQHQLEIVNGDGQFMRYRQDRKDEKGDRIKDVVETSEGFVSRVIAVDGKPLSDDANNGEVGHLQHMLNNQDDLNKHHKREQADLAYTRKMIEQMPTAMQWSMVPEETTPDVVVLDYKPNPSYHPPSLDCSVLKSVAGRLWIDAHTQRMTKIEARLVRDADYGWGLFAHINSGGKIVLEQHPIVQTTSNHPHWVQTYFDMHITGTLMMVKRLNFNITETTSQFQLLPGAPSYADGIRLLLK